MSSPSAPCINNPLFQSSSLLSVSLPKHSQILETSATVYSQRKYLETEQAEIAGVELWR